MGGFEREEVAGVGRPVRNTKRRQAFASAGRLHESGGFAGWRAGHPSACSTWNIRRVVRRDEGREKQTNALTERMARTVKGARTQGRGLLRLAIGGECDRKISGRGEMVIVPLD